MTTDRTTIRQWADEHGSRPVRRTDRVDEVLIVGEESIEEPHEPIEWDEFFQTVDEQDYIVRYYGSDAGDPFDVSSREDVFATSDFDDEELRERLLAGETVESVITETTTVESVIVEEATVESQLVGSDVIDHHVVDAELLGQDCVSCSLSPEESAERSTERDDWFDEVRYLESVPEGGLGAEETTRKTDVADEPTVESGPTAVNSPYTAELVVEEQWAVTREALERFTVESRLEDTDITETDTIEDHDIDIGGLHRTIAEMGILERDLSPDEVMTHYDVETEITADDRVHTHFERMRTVEDEVVGRRRLEAELTGSEYLELEVVSSTDIATETIADEGAAPDRMDAGVGDSGESLSSPDITDDEVGKTVVDANSEEVGMVTSVDADRSALYVEAHPGITDRIKAALDWGSVEEDDYPIEAAQIEEITDDEVRLRGREELRSEEEESR